MSSNSTIQTEVLVLGGGPGGYTAAFRAADLGLKVTLVERYPVLGGVCLNVGCIPSKALLHVALVIHEAEDFSAHGVSFAKPAIDLDKIRAWKQSVSQGLNQGLARLVKQRNITLVNGVGKFVSANSLQVTSADGEQTINFDKAIIAAGSHPTKIPVFPNDDPRLWDSTDALELQTIPEKLLIVGGGIIGLEMATVYHALGSKISVVELQDQIIPGCDKDIVTPLQRRIKKQYDNLWLETKVQAIEATDAGLKVSFEGKSAPESEVFDAVLVAVGRRPNGKLINAEAAGVFVDEAGFIPVDKQLRTNISHIHAIGDIVGNPMLAHKAAHEGKIAAEAISGLKVGFDALTIPGVAYTDPEVAWMGLTETQAKQQGIAYEKATFPWAASGRSLSMGRSEGLTKLITDKETGRILGAGIVGPSAGELIAEAVLALEMGADAEDLSLTIHPHPSLSETLAFAAEMIEGTITDLYIKK
ncbi:dihydrolipoyl dehydrogenase [Methylomonas paludis]|uniref:Dihydrolipoyl dehydrogenase n=1 Tax=Methylomonas paludis TaxID=1173101 RepID=A0A975MNM0_9GAMM|nr:dihydrolipoyl dehydrogenase [Methylomonas paludis]QWF70676.1 dihydrolipoyl dehydrogenase [Methylomonas paludis]